jgi:hypothetical protein
MAGLDEIGVESRFSGPLIVEVMVTVTGDGVVVTSRKLDC